jgi:hypothetical protein
MQFSNILIYLEESHDDYHFLPLGQTYFHDDKDQLSNKPVENCNLNLLKYIACSVLACNYRQI